MKSKQGLVAIKMQQLMGMISEREPRIKRQGTVLRENVKEAPWFIPRYNISKLVMDFNMGCCSALNYNLGCDSDSDENGLIAA